MPLNCEPQFEAPSLDASPVPERFQVTHAASVNPRSQDLEGNRMNVLKEFIKLKPPTFEGQSDPSAAEKWLDKVKEMFDAMKVVEEYRVEFATYLFEGSAEEWWDLNADDHDVDDLNWDEFDTLFREAYAPETLDQLARLSQRTLTVSQYHARFVELLSRVPLAVADPTEKCLKFRKGLKANIQHKLEPFTYNEFSDLVNAALSVETYIERKLKEQNERLEERDRRSSQYRVATEKCIGSTSKQRNEPYRCRNCRQPGHMIRNCPFKKSSTLPNILVCHHCLQVGHIRRACPQLQKAQPAKAPAAASGALSRRQKAQSVKPPAAASGALSRRQKAQSAKPPAAASGTRARRQKAQFAKPLAAASGARARRQKAPFAKPLAAASGARVASTPLLPPGYLPQYGRPNPVQNLSATLTSTQGFYPRIGTIVHVPWE